MEGNGWWESNTVIMEQKILRPHCKNWNILAYVYFQTWFCLKIIKPGKSEVVTDLLGHSVFCLLLIKGLSLQYSWLLCSVLNYSSSEGSTTSLGKLFHSLTDLTARKIFLMISIIFPLFSFIPLLLVISDWPISYVPCHFLFHHFTSYSEMHFSLIRMIYWANFSEVTGCKLTIAYFQHF